MGTNLFDSVLLDATLFNSN